MRALRGEVFDGFPHLLDFADAELGLVEEKEVLVEVVVAVEHVAGGFGMGVASCASGFLDVVFERVADVEVYHQPYVSFVHPHAKGVGGYDDLHLVFHEGLLVLNLFCSLHAAIEGERRDAVGLEPLGQLYGATGARHIDDGGAAVGHDNISQLTVFFLHSLGMDD